MKAQATLSQFLPPHPGESRLIHNLWIGRTFRRFCIGLLIVSIVYVLLWGITDLDYSQRMTLVWFLFIVYLWVSETFPLPVTALMAGVGLLLLGIRHKPEEAFAPYAADAVFMILGSLILAQGVVRSGAERIIVVRLLRHFTSSTHRLLVGIVLICTLLAMVIPDHSVAAIMVPLVLMIIDQTDIKEHRNEMMAFLLAVAFGCSIAGMATPSGGARNVIAIGYLNEIADLQVNYLEWVILAAPLTLILVIPTILVLKFAHRLKNRPLKLELEMSDSINPDQRLALTILGFTILLFLSSGWTGWSLGTVAMVGAILMYATGVLDWDSSREDLRWGIIFIYGAALTLGAALKDENVASWLAEGFLALNPWEGAAVVLVFIILLTALLTQVMSAGATVAVITPITLGFAAATQNHLDFMPSSDALYLAAAMLTALCAAFAFATVFGTPPNIIVHSSGIPKGRDFARAGIPLLAIAIVATFLVSRFYWPWAMELLGWGANGGS